MTRVQKLVNERIGASAICSNKQKQSERLSFDETLSNGLALSLVPTILVSSLHSLCTPTASSMSEQAQGTVTIDTVEGTRSRGETKSRKGQFLAGLDCSTL